MKQKIRDLIIQTLVVTCTALGSIAATYGAAATLGFNLDRPAWYSELQEFAGLSAEALISIKTRQLQEVEFAMEEYKARDKPVPGYLIQRRRQLLRDIRKLESQIR